MSSVVRYIAGSKKTPLGQLQLLLHVKPGAHKEREGVIAVSDTAIDLCVAARAKEGEANKAVVSVLSDVLGIPKSRLHLSRGMKSRDKTVIIQDVDGDGDEYAQTIISLLQKACE